MAQERRISSISPKSRGVTWPKLWWRPEIDSTVCFFLGTADERFDALAYAHNVGSQRGGGAIAGHRRRD